jgi:protein TonB
MTCAAAVQFPSSLPDGSSAASLIPPHLRAGLIGAVVAAHVGALVALGVHAQSVNVLESINVDLIPQGDFLVDTVAIPGAAAAEEVEQRQVQSTPPEAAKAESEESAQAPPPPTVSTDVPPPIVTPDPRAKDAELAALEKRREIQRRKRLETRAEAKRQTAAEERREARAEERRQDIRREARQRTLSRQDDRTNARSSNSGGSEGHRAGVAEGQASRAARMNYGAIIAAALNRHKFYPSGAHGETGSVGVSFTVGASGHIVSHSIDRSSGSAALDGAVHAMMAATHASPPPGGSFPGSIVIHFSLGR